jgi:hypothetical protein
VTRIAEVRVATFVTDRAAYREMRQSFEDAGFVEPQVVYEVLNDRTEEPFGAISRLGSADEKYVVLAHQDVRCDQGHRYTNLLQALECLGRRDARWAVAGNAGGCHEYGLVRHVNDPWGARWADELPCRVITLDENFLVLRTERRPHCSPGMAGFHLYGADVCMNSAWRHDPSYVIDFRVSHLSAGNGTGLREAEDRLGSVWGQRLVRPCYVQTSTMVIPLARWKWTRRLLRRPRIGPRVSHWLRFTPPSRQSPGP